VEEHDSVNDRRPKSRLYDDPWEAIAVEIVHTDHSVRDEYIEQVTFIQFGGHFCHAAISAPGDVEECSVS
jgi:hypothetical protein